MDSREKSSHSALQSEKLSKSLHLLGDHSEGQGSARPSRLREEGAKADLEVSSQHEADQQLEKLRDLLLDSSHEPMAPQRPVHSALLRTSDRSRDPMGRSQSAARGKGLRAESPHSRSPPRMLGHFDSPFRRPPALVGPFASGLQSPEVDTASANNNIVTSYVGTAKSKASANHEIK